MNTLTNDTKYAQDSRFLWLGAVLFGWMLLITALGMDNVFVSGPGEIPYAIIISFAASFTLFTLLYRGFAGFREFILSLDMRFLIMLHSWRMIGMGFIMLHLFDQLPALFAYVAGPGDALTAIGAVFLAYALFSRQQGISRNWIWRWNTFGLIDFVLAVGIGILTRTDALLAPASGLNSDLMTTFPFVLIPAFLVQVFTLTHIIIYLQLKHNHQGEEKIQIAEER